MLTKSAYLVPILLLVLRSTMSATLAFSSANNGNIILVSPSSSIPVAVTSPTTPNPPLTTQPQAKFIWDNLNNDQTGCTQTITVYHPFISTCPGRTFNLSVITGGSFSGAVDGSSIPVTSSVNREIKLIGITNTVLCGKIGILRIEAQNGKDCSSTSPASLAYALAQDTSCTTCPAKKRYDILTCGCVCITKVCPSNMTFNTSICDCSCKTVGTCTTLQQWDPTRCACKCKSTCTGNFVQANNCACLCTLGCPTNYTLNATTCTCKCKTTGTCTGGKIWNSSVCACACPTQTCPTGQVVNNSSCQCTSSCVNTNCTGNFVFNSNNCSCSCPIVTCPSGTLNATNCSCSCPNTTCSNPLQVRNPATCSCGCPNVQTCPTGQVWVNSSCSCQCASTTPCGSGTVLDLTTCTCKNCSSITCVSPFQRVTADCLCLCVPPTCASPGFPNPITCACQ